MVVPTRLAAATRRTCISRSDAAADGEADLAIVVITLYPFSYLMRAAGQWTRWDNFRAVRICIRADLRRPLG